MKATLFTAVDKALDFQKEHINEQIEHRIKESREDDKKYVIPEEKMDEAELTAATTVVDPAIGQTINLAL